MQLTPIRHVAIIGSGIAGLSLAIGLQTMGIKVSLLDKSRGPGGRLSSKRVPGGSVDIGAQYFTIRNPRFQQFLDQYAGTESYRKWTPVLFYEQEPGLPQPFQVAERYVGVPRMTGVSRALSQHVEPTYQLRVDRVEQMQQQWQITDDQQNMVGCYDAVVITAPPEQTRELTRTLPVVQQGLTGFAMEPTWTVALLFSQPLSLAFDGMSLKDSVLGWVARDASKPERDSGEWWVLHATSTWSAAHQDDSPEQVIAAMIQAFAERFNHGQTAVEVISHRWLYARPARGCPQSGFLSFHQDRLAVCGDWLNGGRVEGAWESANQLLEHWRKEQLV
ncbi:MAG: FAD-dependent oxidoreductase [Halomonadaceae bacterium]|nr:MAG: FAD-dependent oxidoreductase [Halomonadaceae bacterium]